MKTLKKNITINSRKFDNSIHKSWKADLINQNDSLLVFLGVFDFDIDHEFLGFIKAGTISYEFYWLEKWFNVFRLHEPDGSFRNFYCNINVPPTFKNNMLNYTDLDIDFIVWKDYSFIILDEDEFIENSIKYNYPDEILINVKSALDELSEKIQIKEFPFDIQPSIKPSI